MNGFPVMFLLIIYSAVNTALLLCHFKRCIDEVILDRDAWQLVDRRAILERAVLNDVSKFLAPFF